MTELNPNGFAIVWFGTPGTPGYGTPRVCKPFRTGTEINGVYYALYDTVQEASEALVYWTRAGVRAS